MRFLITVTLLFSIALQSHGQLTGSEPNRPRPQEPEIAPASDEGERALSGFRIPQGMQGSLFAAEPLLANPVALYVDNQGRVYVCETFRQQAGVEDNRGHAEWLEDDLAAQSVEDRLAYIKKHLGEESAAYTLHDDRIRLLVDTDGDGRADRSTVFADGFNDIVDGTGAGVLAHQGQVYYTCIPNLWLLKDNNGDGKSDVRKSLHYGFGVRFAFRGHDMHGLIVGPDGRLYFSIGDRGYNVETPNGRWKDPASGAVFRCELDGSNLEVFATGLRNPQELAFDEFGNLFTGDNNSDSGDKARWVYVVEGGDSGWRMYYQYLPDRGPFNREQIWHSFHAGQPAYIVPPIANFADGPSGLAYYPGTGLPEYFEGRFFLCDFRGGAANSGVRSFRVKPKGAFFEMADEDQPFWNILATDVAFGPDGGVYVSDWVHGWEGLGKGRIYRFEASAETTGKETVDVKRLLAEGLAEHSNTELATWLGHADQRIRQRAQFALAEKGESKTLAAVAGDKARGQLARLHAIWGVGQLVRRQSGDQQQFASLFSKLLEDEDAEVRAQAARTICDGRLLGLQSSLIPLLNDESLRVRYFAALALGKSGTNAKCVEPLLNLLAENQDQDPIVRHGAIMGLAGSAGPAALVAAAKHQSPSARIGALVALRKQRDPNVSIFLNDVDERLVIEAARAIHDVPLAAAMPELADLISRTSESEPLLRRVLNANFRLGQPAHANALADFAARDDAPPAMRLEAIDLLASWEKPSSRDRVLGDWRPPQPRDRDTAASALRTTLAGVVSGPDQVRVRAAIVAAELGIAEAVPVLKQLVPDARLNASLRAEALSALGQLKGEDVLGIVESSLGDETVAVRTAARNVLSRIDPERAVTSLEAAIYEGELAERQGALRTLGEMKLAAADAVLARALERLADGAIPLDSQLDVLEAARRRKSKRVQSRLARYEQSLPSDDPLSTYRIALSGGEASKGESLFFERSELSCVRCHKIDDRGGEVGPDLSEIGKEKKSDYLLEAIVLPNKTIAKGFESVVVATDEGVIHTGIIRHEDDDILRLMTADGVLVDIEQEFIVARRPGESSMPADLIKHLSLFELRDLVAYLSERKVKQVNGEHR